MAPKSSEDRPRPSSAVYTFRELAAYCADNTAQETYLMKQYIASQRMTGAVKRNQSVIQV